MKITDRFNFFQCITRERETPEQTSVNSSQRRTQNIKSQVLEMNHVAKITCFSAAPRTANPVPKPIVIKHRDRTREKMANRPETQRLFNTNWVFGQYDTAGMKMSSPQPNEMLAQYEVASGIRFLTSLEPGTEDNYLKECLKAVLCDKTHWIDEYHPLRETPLNSALETTSKGDVIYFRHRFSKIVDRYLPKIDGENYLPIKASFPDVAEVGHGLSISMLEELDSEKIPEYISEARKIYLSEKFEHIQQICAEVKNGVVTLRMTAGGRMSPESIGQRLIQIPNRKAVEKTLKEHLGKIIGLLISATQEFTVRTEDLTKELLASFK
jgi:hypothetical protein